MTVTARPGPGGPGLAGLGSESAIDVKAARRFAKPVQRRSPEGLRVRGREKQAILLNHGVTMSVYADIGIMKRRHRCFDYDVDIGYEMQL